MKTLSAAARTAAAAWLEGHARPLEQALYRFHFAGAPVGRVLDQLARFQNPDGGFGHGLEPDIRLEDSSVIATTVAFQRLREVGAPPDHPLVTAGCRYLVEQFDIAGGRWPVVPRGIDRAPHAPWWTPGGDLEKSLANPRAEIAGVMVEYSRHFPDGMRTTVLTSVLDHLDAHPVQMEMHDLLCYLRLLSSPGLPADTSSRMLGRLKGIVAAAVERDPSKWKGYGLQPLMAMDGPRSSFAAEFHAEIELNVDFLIEIQDPDGSWKPNWAWGDSAPEAWEAARKEWTGVLTLDALRKLSAFGRFSP